MFCYPGLQKVLLSWIAKFCYLGQFCYPALFCFPGYTNFAICLAILDSKTFCYPRQQKFAIQGSKQQDSKTFCYLGKHNILLSRIFHFILTILKFTISVRPLLAVHSHGEVTIEKKRGTSPEEEVPQAHTVAGPPQPGSAQLSHSNFSLFESQTISLRSSLNIDSCFV